MRSLEFCNLDEKVVLSQLSTSLDTGLSQVKAAEILSKQGANDLEENQIKWWQIFFRQFKSSFVYLLIAAVILALILGEIIDAILVGSFIIINSVLGFVQEYRSETTIQSLKKFTQGKARVRRDGVERTIVNTELVPGDIVIIETGDIIPADIRILRAHNFLVDESILTGESIQIAKTTEKLDRDATQPFEAQNMVFKGTSVLNGKAEGVVVTTGKNTEIGQISGFITETKKESAFQKNINRISKFIIWLVVATIFIVLFIHYFVLEDSAKSFADMVIFAIALTVGVIPEALPLVTTFSLSSGAKKLAQKSVVVKRLTSIEDLGSIQVLCTDKTGTITQNKLTVSEVLSLQKDDTPIFLGCLAISNIFEEDALPNNAFDLSLLAKLDDNEKQALTTYHLLNENPFDPSRRRNSALVEKDGRKILIVRGSPEEMVALDRSLSQDEKHAVLSWIARQGENGRRTLAVSAVPWEGGSQYQEVDEEQNIRISGIISFVDELKPTTKAVVQKAKDLGVRIVVLTGDDPVVAGAVGYDAKIIESSQNVMTGAEFDALSADEKDSVVKRINIFARVSPRQKFEIIQLLQKSFQVGFLGEGINDAPALKAANVSLVVESASDIARETADIVLLKHDLGVIIEGIVEGRKAFSNTLTYIRATLLSNFGNFYAVAFASLLIPYLPMLPVQILLVNLLSDFPMFSISTDNVSEKDLRNPKNYNTKDIIVIASLLGLVSTLFDFIIFGTFQRYGEGILQTYWFIGSIATELVLLFSIRTNKVFYKANTAPSWTIVILSVAALTATFVLPFTRIGMDLFHFVRPTWDNLGILLMIVIGYFLTTEFVKGLYYRYLDRV